MSITCPTNRRELRQFKIWKDLLHLRTKVLSPNTGMDQGSDFISGFVSDFGARRIRTQITWENLSANCHEVTESCLMRVADSGTASAGAGSGNEGNKATKKRGMIRDPFPGINSPGLASVEQAVQHAPGLSAARTRL